MNVTPLIMTAINVHTHQYTPLVNYNRYILQNAYICACELQRSKIFTMQDQFFNNQLIRKSCLLNTS